MSEEEFTFPDEMPDAPEPDVDESTQNPDAQQKEQQEDDSGPTSPSLAQFEALKLAVEELKMKQRRDDDVELSAVEIERLKGMVESLQARVDQHGADAESDNNFRVFIARAGSTALQFQERAIISGSGADFVDGRKCEDDGDSSALYELDADQFAVLEMDDVNGGATCKRFVRLSDGVGSTATPVEIGDSVLGSESASTDDWALADDELAVDVWIEVRQRYYSSGDKKWYAYARLFRFDSKGKLYSISPEVRFVVETPDDCSGGTSAAFFFAF